MKITLESIPHSQQRYETVGDWVIEPNGDIKIFVSDMGNDDYNFLVALHELVEVKLCQKAGVTQAAVDAFDIEFEKNRKPCNEDEPGDSPDAPYERQHNIASGIERIMAAEMGVKFDPYDTAVNSL